MKLVVGTRHWIDATWTHLDINPTPLIGPDGRQHPVDIVSDAMCIPLEDGMVEHLWASEVLEHFYWSDTAAVVGEWCRLLRPGGTIRIEVPDFLAACQQVLGTDTLEMDLAIQQIIFGGQVNQYDVHFTGLTPRMLTSMLEAVGMEVVNIQRGFECGWLRVDARKP